MLCLLEHFGSFDRPQPTAMQLAYYPRFVTRWQEEFFGSDPSPLVGRRSAEYSLMFGTS